jgi:methionine-S-sulfoxide reductase
MMRVAVLAVLAIVALGAGIVGFSLIMAAEIKAPKAGTRTPVGQPGKAATPVAVPGIADSEEGKTETAVFAGGCFWCTEFAFEQVAGVVDVESGYCGGTKATANYDRVHLGTTAHAEAIRVTYDPNKVSYEDLLAVFFDAHDPTQLNRQGEGDIGRQYRSANRRNWPKPRLPNWMRKKSTRNGSSPSWNHSKNFIPQKTIIRTSHARIRMCPTSKAIQYQRRCRCELSIPI